MCPLGEQEVLLTVELVISSPRVFISDRITVVSRKLHGHFFLDEGCEGVLKPEGL